MGEQIAVNYLQKLGYKILEQNYTCRWGEIDVIAKDGRQTIVFVEVKTLKSGGAEWLSPEDNATAAKLRKLRRTCEMFVGANPDMINDERGWRIDLVAISIGDEEKPDIKHYENI